MNSKIVYIALVCCLIGTLASFHLDEGKAPAIHLVPKGWPKPIYNFSGNPITSEGFELGRKLFYDTGLSRDNSTSCASCHLQYTGFTHVDHNVSHGIEGKKGTRNAPVIINLAWNNTFHWDGGVNHLEMQPINPIQHPAEMDNKLENVLAYLNASSVYKQMFFEAFGDSTITTKWMLKAMAQFTVSLVSANSKYDQYIKGEIKLSKQERNGMKLFKKHCNSCHTMPLFNSNKFASNGLPVDPEYNDLGRYNITHNSKDSLQFRIPTLRNLAHTFPYMHDGRFRKLKQVIDYYSDSIDVNNNYLSEELRKPLHFTEYEKKDLLAFLYTLTDKEFLYNKRFSFPR